MINLLEKLTVLENNVVSQGSIKHDLNILDRELTKVLYSKSGRGVVISGESGSGKTTLLNKFLEKTKERFVSEGIISEPVCFDTPANTKGKAFYYNFLTTIGTPSLNSQQIASLAEYKQVNEIKTMIVTKNIRVVVMDEFHHVTERMGDMRVKEIADELKLILNNYPILLIFAGTNKVEDLLNNEQFMSRATLISKKYMTIDKRKDFDEFREYLNSLQHYASIDGVNFNDPDIALPIFYETRGDLRQITDILNDVITEAVMKEQTEIFKTDFKSSWKQRFKPEANKRVAFTGNPFNKTIDQLKNALNINYDV